MQIESFTAPSSWASAIVNNDYSGLEPDEVSALNTWLAENRLSFRDCLTCEGAGFMRRHDAYNQFPYAADCQTYTFPSE